MSCAHHDGLELRMSGLELTEGVSDPHPRDPDQTEGVAGDRSLHELLHLRKLGRADHVEDLQLLLGEVVALTAGCAGKQ